MLNNLRPKINPIIEPIAKKININPNYITIVGLIISLLAAYMFSQKSLLFAAILICFSGIFDMLDGAIARANNKKTKFGGVFDSVIDRFSDAVLIIGAITGGYVSWFIGVLTLFACVIVSYIRARAEAENINCNVGIAERAERVLILIIGALLGTFINEKIMYWAVIIIMILSYFTVLQRMYHAWKLLK